MVKLPGKKKKVELEGVVAGDMKDRAKEEAKPAQINGLKEHGKSHVASSDLPQIPIKQKIKTQVSKLSRKQLIVASILAAVFLVSAVYLLVILNREDAKQAPQKSEMQQMIEDIRKNPPANDAMEGEKLQYSLQLINTYIVEKNCEKVIELFNQVEQQKYKSIQEPQLNAIAMCYNEAKNYKVVAAIFDARIAQLENYINDIRSGAEASSAQQINGLRVQVQNLKNQRNGLPL